MSFHKRTPTKLQIPNKKVKTILLSNTLVIVALGLLIIGLGTSLYTWRTDEIANQQAAKLIYAANHNIRHTVPSTAKPTAGAAPNYVVAPTLPSYLIIPELSINAPILAVGVNAQVALEAPSNINDTAWYNESSQPGQPGAMLIDGHISSWTAPGVFYDLKTLQPGNTIEVRSGNGAIFTYQVVITKVYSFNNVNMAMAMTSINPNKPGLNLISCTGDIIPGTSEFDERIIVFATQV